MTLTAKSQCLLSAGCEACFVFNQCGENELLIAGGRGMEGRRGVVCYVIR